jgi:hypothetical protein
MALIEKYHVVAAVKAVATGQTIKEGQFVSLNSTGEVVLQNGTNKVPYGIAGDTKSTTASAMPGVASGWQNRASDYYDETKASAKITVYHSGGEFATDQFHGNVAALTPGAILYAVSGLLADTDSHSSNVAVAILTQADGAYPSGVPGTDINGDAALSGDNSNTYVEIKLLI